MINHLKLIFIITALISFLTSSFVFGEEAKNNTHDGKHQHEENKKKGIFSKKKNRHQKINPLDYDYILDVEGLVCSFCANKLRTILKKIDFIESGNKKDFFVDLKKQKIYLKVRKEKVFDFAILKNDIEDSGYKILHVGTVKEGRFENKDKIQITFVDIENNSYPVAKEIKSKQARLIKKQLKKKKTKKFILFFKNLENKDIYKIKPLFL